MMWPVCCRDVLFCACSLFSLRMLLFGFLISAEQLAIISIAWIALLLVCPWSAERSLQPVVRPAHS